MEPVIKIEMESQVCHVFKKEKKIIKPLGKGKADMSEVGNHCFIGHMVI